MLVLGNGFLSLWQPQSTMNRLYDAEHNMKGLTCVTSLLLGAQVRDSVES